MDESITVRISGGSSSLITTFSPIINVRGGSEIALISLQTTKKVLDSQVLIDKTNNRMKIKAFNLDIEIDEGYYSIRDIDKYIKNVITENFPNHADYILFDLTPIEKNTKCKLTCNRDIDFNVENSLASTLGFEKKLYTNLFNNKNLIEYYVSEKINYELNISSSIKVMCNIAKGSFDNGQQSTVIYEFFPRLETEIVESPNNLIYYKLKTAVIKKIKIDLVNQENKPIHNSNEQATVILHIRPIKY